MCKYCDVRMPDGCGFEEHGKNEHVMMTLYPDGYAHFACGGYGGSNVEHDSIKFNYCPMCGKPLDDNTDELLYLVYDPCHEYRVYDTQNEAREYAEEIASEHGAADVLTVAVVQSNTCEVRCCWDDE